MHRARGFINEGLHYCDRGVESDDDRCHGRGEKLLPSEVDRVVGGQRCNVPVGLYYFVAGIAEAVDSSKAQVVYVCNLRPQVPETDGFDVSAHVDALARHNVTVDVVVCDSIQGMSIGATDVPVHDVPLTSENRLVHSPAKLAQALAGLLA